MKILHLDSSILGDASATRQLSAAVADRLRAIDPTAQIVYRDLAATPLPHVTPEAIGGAESSALIDELLSADVLVIGAPMYNLGLPTQLKAWFDHVLVAGRTFRYTEQGPEGLATGKRAILALSRGGIYSDGPMAAFEHSESHLRAMLSLIGITDHEVVLAEGIAFGPEQREAALTAALNIVDTIEPRKQVVAV